MNPVLFYILWALSNYVVDVLVQEAVVRDLSALNKRYETDGFSYSRSYLFGGKHPPPSLKLLACLAERSSTLEELWPKVAVTSLYVRETLDSSVLPRLGNLRFMDDLSLDLLSQEVLPEVAKIRTLRVLETTKGFADGALRELRSLRTLLMCSLHSRDSGITVNDADIESLFEANQLRLFYGDGKGVTPVWVEVLMDNPFLECIDLYDLNPEYEQAWRQLARLHPYMDVTFYPFEYARGPYVLELGVPREKFGFGLQMPSLPRRPLNRADDLLIKWLSDPTSDACFLFRDEKPFLRRLVFDYVPNALEMLNVPEHVRDAAYVLKHPALVSKVQFTPNCRQLVTACRDGIRIWDVISSKVIKHFTEVREWTQFALSSDGIYLAISGGNQRALVYHLGSSRLVATIEGLPDVVTCLEFSPSGKTLAIGCYDGTVHLIKKPFDEHRISRRVNDIGAPVSAVVLLNESVFVTACRWRQSASRASELRTRAWRIFGSDIVEVDSSLRHCSTAAAVPGTPWVVVGGRGTWSGLQAWHIGDGVVAIPARVWTEAPEYSYPCWIPEPLFYASSSFGTLIAAGGSEGDIRIIDLRHPRFIRLRLVGHEGLVLSIAASADGKLLASGSKDRTVRIWDIGKYLSR